MDPSGPSQPSLNTVYGQPSNPTTQTDSEIKSSNSTSASLHRSGPATEARKPNDIPVPSQHGHDATPSSLEQGARNAGGDRGDELGTPVSNTEGEQMRAPGEGDVYNAQQQKTGFGEQGDLAADLDRKREEQDRLKEERSRGNGDNGVDVEGAVSGAGKGFVGVKSGSGGGGVGASEGANEVSETGDGRAGAVLE